MHLKIRPSLSFLQESNKINTNIEVRRIQNALTELLSDETKDIVSCFVAHIRIDAGSEDYQRKSIKLVNSNVQNC
jgi:hypothetical protein